jgi:putative phosphoesterase
MRIGVVADVHGNLVALEAAIAALREAGAKRILCCGDLVGRGPQPREVVERILESRITCVRGTFDEEVARGRPRQGGRKRRRQVEWAAGELRRSDRKALGELPVVRELRITGRKVLLCHGSPRDVREALHAATPAALLQEALGSHEPDVLICGASHEPFVRLLGRTLIVNAGTTGSSDDGDVRAHAALIDVGPRVTARVLRVPYDLRRAVRTARRLPRADRKEWIESVLGLSVVAARAADVSLSASSPAAEGAAVLLVSAARPLALAERPRKVSQLRELRTAALRLRELLAAFASYLPEAPAHRLDRRARRLFRALAAPRNAAVAARALESLRLKGRAGREVEALVTRLRASSRGVRRIEKALSEHAGLSLAVAAGDVAPMPGKDAATLGQVSARALAERAAALLRHQALLDLPHAHDVHHERRKLVRKLRLALELYGPWAHSPAVVLSAARAAQEALGRVRDLALAERRARHLSGPTRRVVLEAIAAHRLLALRDAAAADDRLVAELRDRMRGAA